MCVSAYSVYTCVYAMHICVHLCRFMGVSVCYKIVVLAHLMGFLTMYEVG